MLASSFQLADDFAPVDAEQWRALVETELDGAPFDKKLVTRLYEGLNLQPIYTDHDWAQAGDPSGFPGASPYVRGSRALRRGWEIRQAYDHPDPVEINRQILSDLERGTTGVLLRLNAAARAGSEANAAEGGEAEHGGVVIGSLADLAAALEGVRTEAAPVTLEPGAAFLATAALLAAHWRRQGTPAKGNLGADPLGALAADGRVSGSIAQAMTQMVTLAAWTDRHMPGVTAVQVSTAAYHDAGATTVQELALALATGVEYLRAMTGAGIAVDAACGRMEFSFRVGTHFFRSIAKLRAARKLWARVAEACGANDSSRGMRMHVATAPRSLTRRDPWVNILRATAGCFAGAVAGAEAMTVEPFDTRLGPADENSRRLARNTQIILAEESHLGGVMDPAGGCWFLEKLTDELAGAAWKLFQEIEKQGGAARALTSGWVGGLLDATWNERLKALVRRKDPITGVSEFPNLREKLPERPGPDWEGVRRRSRDRTAARRIDGQPQAALEKAVALKGGDQFEAVIAAAGAGATLGEMSRVLGWKTTEALTPLPARPFAAPFEMLRDAADAFLAKTGARPKVFQANLGPVAQHTARAGWSRNFFEAGGFEVIGSGGFADAGAAAEAWKASGARLAAICSSDKIYAERAAETAGALKAAGARTVILAGHPGDQRESWSGAGVDLFIHAGCDVQGTLATLLKQEGALA